MNNTSLKCLKSEEFEQYIDFEDPAQKFQSRRQEMMRLLTPTNRIPSPPDPVDRSYSLNELLLERLHLNHLSEFTVQTNKFIEPP